MKDLEVATGGSIPRVDTCSKCGDGMLFRIQTKEHDSGWRSQRSPHVIASFCGNFECSEALKEIPE